MEGKGKGDGHQHARKPKIPEPVPIAWKLPLVRRHWTPMGTDPMEQWIDGWLCGWESF